MGNAIRLYLGTRERLEGGVISLCGAGGVCEAINENWLAACRIKDQLQPKSPPRRIYNPLCCGLGSFGFDFNFRECIKRLPGPIGIMPVMY